MGQQPLAPRVVGVVHADVAAIEQDGLGVAVGLHGAVEVQMVLTEIGEDAHGEAHAVDPVQHQRVGGDLHDHVGAAGVGHLAEQPLQLEGLRRGALRGERLPADHVLDGADEAHLGAGLLLENALDEVGGGGLAAGAGNADHGHLPGGVIEPAAGDDRQRAAGILHNHIGNLTFRCTLAYNAHGPLVPGHGDKSVTVRLRASDGHEQAAGLGLAGVVADVGDIGVQIGVDLQQGQVLEHIAELHGNDLLCFHFALL